MAFVPCIKVQFFSRWCFILFVLIGWGLNTMKCVLFKCCYQMCVCLCVCVLRFKISSHVMHDIYISYKYTEMFFFNGLHQCDTVIYWFIAHWAVGAGFIFLMIKTKLLFLFYCDTLFLHLLLNLQNIAPDMWPKCSFSPTLMLKVLVDYCRHIWVGGYGGAVVSTVTLQQISGTNTG